MAIYVSTGLNPPQSVYQLITRQGQTFVAQKMTDPVDPFGSDKTPHHTVARLKDFAPNLQDLLIFSSSATPDIGLLSRAKAPLSDDNVINEFATTELLDDSKRATMPMNDSMETPAPVGTVLDLSGKAPVYKPIPTDEMEQSAGPLPGYWVLNEEGVLSVWWIVYTESIREGTTYAGLAAIEGNAGQSTPLAQPALVVKANPFGTPNAPAFGAPSSISSSAFGNTSALGSKPSPWTSQQPASTSSNTFGSGAFGGGATSSAPKFGQASFGQPAFGQTSTLAFGQSSGVGAKSSLWGTAATIGSAGSGFGGSASESTPKGPGGFGSTAAAPASGGFASFASQGGFSSLESHNNKNSGGNIFASSKTPADQSMGTDTNTPFLPGAKPSASTSNPFGSTPFKLTSAFKPDPKAQDDESPTDKSAESKSLFGSGFASAIGETTTSSGSGLFGGQSPTRAPSTTPTTTPAPSKFFAQAPATTQKGGLFGLPAKSSTSLFGSTTPGTPRIKAEEEKPRPLQEIPDIPLPPDTTSKASYSIGDSSSSSTYSVTDSVDLPKISSDVPLPPESPPAEDAPLPPDPTTNKKLYDVKIPPLPEAVTKLASASADDAPLPPDPRTNKKAYDVKFAPIPGIGNSAEKKVGSVFDSMGSSTPKSTSLFSNTGTPTQTGSIFGSSKPAQPTSIFGSRDQSTPKSGSIFGSTDQSTPKSGSVFDTGKKSTMGFLFPTDLPPMVLSSDEEDESGEDEDDEDDENDEEQDNEGEEEDDEEEEDDDEDEEEEEEEDDRLSEASEGSGVDVAKELSPPSGGKDKTTPAITPGSSFGGLGGSFSTISKPETERRSLFGELGRSIPSLPQPNPLSPRSPSPVRNAFTSRFAGDQSRSFSAPGMASQILGASKPAGSRGAPIVSKEAPLEDPRIAQRAKAKAKKDADETQLLVDEDDDLRQQQLNAPIDPTLQLDEFIAHTGPLPVADDSIPAQVEAVYRDINAMIDTLGLNARSLENFIVGHAEAFRHDQRDKNELARAEDWTIGELDDLRIIISEDLVNDLSDARIEDVQEKIAECQELQRDLKRDFSKRAEIQKMINAKVDPEQALTNRSLPLTAEQAARQNDLRRDFARFTKTLAEAEESLTLLKAKVVSAKVANGKAGSAPTIDAVVRTITKMTSMVEKRSGDVDVLENQMRRLRFNTGSPAPGFSHGTRSREGTPTSQKIGSSSIFSPERSFREGTPTRNSVMRYSMPASVSSIGNGMFAVRTPPRKKLSVFGELEKKAVKERRDKKTVVLGKLRNSLQKKGAIVWNVDDIQ